MEPDSPRAAQVNWGSPAAFSASIISSQDGARLAKGCPSEHGVTTLSLKRHPEKRKNARCAMSNNHTNIFGLNGA